MNRSFNLLLLSCLLLTGCTGTHYSYSPKDQMVVLQSHNNFLHLGPCGMPWNYDDQLNILLPADSGTFTPSQLEIYQYGKLTILSGSVTLDPTNKTVAIDLTLAGYEHAEDVPLKCKYNGLHHYTERDPGPDALTRYWLQDFYRTNEPAFYEP